MTKKVYPKRIETLVDDIYGLFSKEEGHQCNEQNLKEFGERCADLLRRRLQQAKPRTQGNRFLRLSEIGGTDLEIWHGVHGTEIPEAERLKPSDMIKFLFGDLTEELLLLLVKEAGHTVEEEQKRVDLDGVKGAKDCRIDGVTTDIKSASPSAFDMFLDRSYFTKVKSFGVKYLYQIASYTEADKGQGFDDERGAFLVLDKQQGRICLPIIHDLEFPDVRGRVAHLKEVVQQDTPPSVDSINLVPIGKGGNIGLSSEDKYNPYKWDIFPNLRGFMYSTGPVYLTTVVKEPNVPEFNREGVYLDQQKGTNEKESKET